jgi:hypothetical protein
MRRFVEEADRGHGRFCLNASMISLTKVTLLLVLSIFAVDAGCGYFGRERISKKRRELYLESWRARRSRHGSPALGRFLRHSPRPIFPAVL